MLALFRPFCKAAATPGARHSATPRRDVTEIDADARHDAVLQRVFVHRLAVPAEVARRVDVGTGVVRHRDEHRGKPVHLAGFGERFLVGLPDAVDDGRMARIARGTVVEFTAEIDDLHDWYPLR